MQLIKDEFFSVSPIKYAGDLPKSIYTRLYKVHSYLSQDDSRIGNAYAAIKGKTELKSKSISEEDIKFYFTVKANKNL